MRRVGFALSIFLALPLIAFAENQKPATNDLGNRVVEFAKSQIGKQVGQGECAHLVIAALNAAGAKTTIDYGSSGPEKDYVWGTPVAKYNDAQPGDLLQFRDVRIKSEILVNGQKRIRTAFISHHSSIVLKNLGKGKLQVLEQNVNGVKTVRVSDWNLADQQGGKIWIYRPEKK